MTPPSTSFDPFGRFLKLTEVERSVGIKRTKIYQLMRDGDTPFPKPLKIDNASVWIEAEIIGWKAMQIARERNLPDPIEAFRSRLRIDVEPGRNLDLKTKDV